MSGLERIRRGAPRLTALVCVRDEEAALPQCLDRLSFCDEMVVVADRCVDGSEAVARRYGAVVVCGIYPLESQRKEAGLDAATGDWIFEVDADEHVTPALAAEIRQTIAREDADWFQVPIDNYVGERLVRHGWGGSFGTSSVGRLFRRGHKSWKSGRVHPGTTFGGRYGGLLKNAMAHNVDRDIGDMLARFERYTALRGMDLAEGGKFKGLPSNCFRAVRRFWKCYVRRKGYREGEIGFLIALLAGLFPLVSELRAKEYRRQLARAALPAEAAQPEPVGAMAGAH